MAAPVAVELRYRLSKLTRAQQVAGSRVTEAKPIAEDGTPFRAPFSTTIPVASGKDGKTPASCPRISPAGYIVVCTLKYAEVSGKLGTARAVATAVVTGNTN